METGAAKREQKSDLDNFTGIDVDILLMQNKSLMTEVLRLKQATQQDETKHQIASESNRVMHEAYTRTKGAVSNFLNVLEDFAIKSNIKWVYSLYEVINENLNDLLNLIDAGRSVKASSFDCVYKFDELFKNNFPLLNSDYNKLDNDKIISQDQKIDVLSMKNADLTRELKELREELESYKRESPEFKGLKEDLELLAWKNKVLENRINFIVAFEINDIDKALETMNNQSFAFCYCGGKNFRAFKEEIKSKMINKMPSKVDTNVSKQDAQIDDDSNNKISQLKKELADLIEIAENRRVDKVVVGKQILNSNFVNNIKQYLNEYYDYVKDLELRLTTYGEYLADIERSRINEIEISKIKEYKERQKLEDVIYDLRKKLINTDNGNNSNKAVKYETSTRAENNQKLVEFESIIKSQIQTIETLTSKVVNNMESKIVEGKKHINYLEKKLYAYKDQEILDSKYLDKDFRHSTHKSIFETLYQAFASNAEMVTQLQDMEKYVKSREEKYKSLEKRIKKQTEQLEAEQADNKSLIQEISNSAVAFQKIQTIEETLRVEHVAAEENFAQLIRERNDDKMGFERQITQLKTENQAKSDQINNDNMQIKTYKKYVKQKEYEFTDESRKVKELTTLLGLQGADRDSLKAELDQKETEIVILNNKIQAVENSIVKLSSQISDNLSVIAEKESIIKSVISESRNQGGDIPDISSAQKEEYFINKLELKRLRGLIICKVCNINEKTTVLTTCFHTFCEDCVQQKLKSRDRNCPVCMVKINKYDVQKLYLG